MDTLLSAVKCQLSTISTHANSESAALHPIFQGACFGVDTALGVGCYTAKLTDLLK